MKTHILSGFIGFLIGTIILSIVLESKYKLVTLMSIFMMAPDRELPKSIEPYQGEALNSFTDYEITAPFINPDDAAYVIHQTSLTFFRQEPAFQVYKDGFSQVCAIEAKGPMKDSSSSLTIGFKLRPHMREKLKSLFLEQDEQYAGVIDSYQQRFFLEVSGDLIKWFWVTDKDALAYDTAIKNGDINFDFTISVPEDQFYNLQFYLTNEFLDEPLKGCTDDVDLNVIPHWKALVNEVWNFEFP